MNTSLNVKHRAGICFDCFLMRICTSLTSEFFFFFFFFFFFLAPGNVRIQTGPIVTRSREEEAASTCLCVIHVYIKWHFILQLQALLSSLKASDIKFLFDLLLSSRTEDTST